MVLGLIEGLSEFLPISSTGHLILVNQWFAFGEAFTKLFDIVIQAGAILAIIILFWKDMWPETWNFKSLEKKWGKIFIAFIFTSVIALLFANTAERYLFSPFVVAAALIFYGVVFLLLEKFQVIRQAKESSYSDAVIIGLIQALALVPGTSRSGITMVGMLLLGYARPQAAKFSFLLAVPTLLAASAYSLLKYKTPISGSEYGYLAIGFFVSFIVAYGVSKWFMAYISKNTFIPFAWYRIVLGILIFGSYFLAR